MYQTWENCIFETPFYMAADDKKHLCGVIRRAKQDRQNIFYALLSLQRSMSWHLNQYSNTSVNARYSFNERENYTENFFLTSLNAVSYGWLCFYCQKENKKALKTSTRKPMVHVLWWNNLCNWLRIHFLLFLLHKIWGIRHIVHKTHLEGV